MGGNMKRGRSGARGIALTAAFAGMRHIWRACDRVSCVFARHEAAIAGRPLAIYA